MKLDQRSSARRIRRTQTADRFARSHSQIRNTCQPARRNVRVTTRSRALLADNFRRQNARLFAGLVACLGQPCQKQPSTKTASLNLEKTKSGLALKLLTPDS